MFLFKINITLIYYTRFNLIFKYFISITILIITYIIITFIIITFTITYIIIYYNNYN